MLSSHFCKPPDFNIDPVCVVKREIEREKEKSAKLERELEEYKTMLQTMKNAGNGCSLM